MSQFQCPNCHVISEEVTVQVDERQIKINADLTEKYKKANEESDREDRERKESLKKEREQLLIEYGAYEDRDCVEKLTGVKPYQERYTFDTFLFKEHYGCWAREPHFPLFTYNYLILMGCLATNYVECPNCSKRHRFNKEENTDTNM